tara:strand:+ start:1641 stop:2927 length:1287 start_codon:yes stop_codon:yes gene_type:complete
MRAIRSRVLHWPTDQWHQPEYFEDGILLIDAGKVLDLGPAARFIAAGFDVSICEHYPTRLVLPGFIDAHLHFPQVDVMASFGAQLLDWLQDYTFPAEARYSDLVFAEAAAESFLDLQLRHGTTSGFAFCSSHRNSVEALFQAAERRQLRMVAGKVLMDQNAPQAILDTAESGARDSEDLIKTWHGRGRLGYALTPRFSGTSSKAQLEKTGQLAQQYPTVWLQTHLSENLAEIAWIKSVHPEYRDYLHTYEAHGLVPKGSLFGHCIHLTESETKRLADAGGVAVFCPSSNLFLGSGLMPFEALQAAGVELAIASDIGGGTSLSMLKTLADAYKVCQLRHYVLHPYEAFYRITRGNARATALDAFIGDFRVGQEADFVMIDPACVPLVARRVKDAKDLQGELFIYMTLGDEQLIVETSILGEPAYRASNP